MGVKAACGCSGGAPTGVSDPYLESLQVVWHDPTQYDPNRHAPPYMPKMASDQKALVRSLVASISPKVIQKLAAGYGPMSALLGMLRAASFLHQTHHWQTRGKSFFADHLLFERLYNESQPFIDQVAERAVGSEDESQVSAIDQANYVAELVGLMAGASTPEDFVQSSLRMELAVVASIGHSHFLLKSEGKLSNGTDNLLQGTADLHETFVYLLKQRSKTDETIYAYGR